MSLTSARTKRYTSVWEALADPQIVTSILILYCLLHFVVRMLLTPNFTLDESEQILFGQSLEWGYRFRHPPLITWLSWGTLAATGQSRAAFFLLKYALMLGGLLAYFQAGRLVIRDDRLAGLATFGMLTTITMGYMPHIDLMHTVLLASMLAAYMWADARVIQSGKWLDYILLGIVTGLGILSKYIFVVLPIAMTIGVLFVPRFRARLRLVPLVAALLIAIAIVAPYAYWASAHEYSLFALAQTITKSQGPALNFLVWLKGTGNLIVALVGFVVPLIVIFPLLYWNACKPLPAGEDEDHDWLKLYGVSLLVGALIMWAAVFFVGTEAFKERWMHQVMLLFPIWLFLRVKIAVGVFAARVAIYETDGSHCKTCREYWPMKVYADNLRKAGFVNGTILSPTYDLAGNLRGVFPEARVVTPGYPIAVFGPPVPGQCLVVWDNSGDMPKAARDYLAGAMGAVPGNTDIRGDLFAQLLTTHKMHAMSYLLMPGCGAAK
jgi:hypothetical protein